MNNYSRLLTFLYTIALFLSAFLLFVIQPLFSKMLLPYLGGSPMVWNIAMVFFQGMLLAGYGYAFFCAKLPKLWMQIVVHAGLFCLFIAFLPFYIDGDNLTTDVNNPTLWQITLMLTTIGAPFFIISGCAPLLQRWFSYADHPDADNPYFLYSASNVGSMLSLLSYPFVIEPLFGVRLQTELWFYGYSLLIALIAICGVITFKQKRRIGSSSTPAEKNIASESPVSTPTLKIRAFWLFLAFIPSSLMLGVTTFITTDIASAPLLWIFPLAIYVGTFILAFAKNRLIDIDRLRTLHLAALAVVGSVFITDNLPLMGFEFLIHIIAFAIITLSCHYTLADNKPHVRYLTEFYFFMSFGGVLGGLFNALLAPMIFTLPWEYALVLALSALAIFPQTLARHLSLRQYCGNFSQKIVLPILCIFVVLALSTLYLDNAPIVFAAGFAALILPLFFRNAPVIFSLIILFVFLTFSQDSIRHEKTIYMARNFFGIVKVNETEEYRTLMHGTTLHGVQYKDEELDEFPAVYYHPQTALGDVFTKLEEEEGQTQKIAVMGMGAASVGCFGNNNWQFDFYEIDPLVIALSEDLGYFSYLDKCETNYETFLGDGRIKIAEAENSYYDLIFLDAFSSDNIPVHLLTKEAIQEYLKKLEEDGLILSHISNRHLDLRPVLASIAADLGLSVRFKYTHPTYGDGNKEDTAKQTQQTSTAAVLLARNDNILEPYAQNGWIKWPQTGQRYLWTDDYANIISTFSFTNNLAKSYMSELKKQDPEYHDMIIENIKNNQ